MSKTGGGSGNEVQEFFGATRRGLAELYRLMNADQLPRLFSGDVGRLHRLLVGGALPYEPLPADEAASAERAAVEAAGGSAGALLTAMLYGRAHRQETSIELSRVPGWMSPRP